MFVITMYFEGLKEDWFCQLGHPRKIKNLLTYLLTYLLKAYSIPYKMKLVCTLSVGAFWRDGLLNTLPICYFTVYTKCVIKYA